MISIDCKITHFSLYLFGKHNNYGWLITSSKEKWKAHALRIDYLKAHKPVCFVLSYVLSITQQYKQRTARKASLQSIQSLQKIKNITHETHAPYLDA